MVSGKTNKVVLLYDATTEYHELSKNM